MTAPARQALSDLGEGKGREQPLGSLWNLAVHGTQDITTLPDLCKRVRFRKSDCRRCVEVCPDDAIELRLGPVVSDRCSDCGLCQNACPTEALRSGLRTEFYLLNRTASLLRQEEASGRPKELVVHCREAQSQGGDALPVSCLGGVSENVIIGAALLGFDQVSLVTGICSECRLEQGEKLLSRSVACAKAVLEGMALLENIAIAVVQEPGERETVRSRREIFSSLARRMRDHAAFFGHRTERAIRERVSRELGREDQRATPSPRRELLRELLDRGCRANPGAVVYRREFPWGRIRVREGECSACGVCARVCPTGAICEEAEKGSRYRLHFDASACTNCGLCQEACPLIEFDERFALADITGGQSRIVASVELSSCVVCGEVIPAGGREACSTCAKRQLGPARADLGM
jgi:formate hydrogenlyase subunit 6/NADH:ubiquinone oxidoreductase subunit I